MNFRIVALLLAIVLAGCDGPVIKAPSEPLLSTPAPMLAPRPRGQAPILVTPTPTPKSLVTEAGKPFVVAPKIAPVLSGPGYNLILEYEIGGRAGYDPHPELPDLRYSGVTIGIGADLHQTTKAVILDDWSMLRSPDPQRLAETQPFYGKSAVEPWKKVRDILVPWAAANDVFMRLDVGREFRSCRKVYPGFDELRPNAQASLISLNFNRGSSMIGDSRREMRAIRDLVPKKSYAEMAAQFRIMSRVWTGTSISRGMTRRRLSEAKLMETP